MEKLVKRYFAFQFFFSLLVWLPVFYEFQKKIGLSDTEIFGIQSIYYVIFALLEIPTGFFADRVGTRQSMRAGAIALVIANLLPPLAPSYSGMLGHFILIALSRSLISGASSAYLYDFLKNQGAAVQYKELEGKARAYSLLGKIVCWSAVGFLMKENIMLPYYVSALAAAIAVVFAWILPGLPAAVSSPAKLSTSRKLKEISGIIRQSPLLVAIMVQGIALFVMVRILQVNLFQPILVDKQFTLESFGIIMAAMTVFEALGSWSPRRFQFRLNDYQMILVLSLAMAVTLAVIPFAGTYGTLGSLFVFSLIGGLSFPVQKQLLNDAITANEHRATLLSIESILDRSVCALVAIAIGDFLARGALHHFLIWAAVTTAVVMVIVGFVVYLLQSRSGEAVYEKTHCPH